MRTILIALALVCAGCGEQAVEPKTIIEYIPKLVDRNDCQQVRDFATWCQKSHPDVWREYHSTITGGR